MGNNGKNEQKWVKIGKVEKIDKFGQKLLKMPKCLSLLSFLNGQWAKMDKKTGNTSNNWHKRAKVDTSGKKNGKLTKNADKCQQMTYNF